MPVRKNNTIKMTSELTVELHGNNQVLSTYEQHSLKRTIANNPQAKYFELYNVKMTKALFQEILLLLNDWPLIKHFHFENSNLRGCGLLISQFIKHHPNMREVDIIDCNLNNLEIRGIYGAVIHPNMKFFLLKQSSAPRNLILECLANLLQKDILIGLVFPFNEARPEDFRVLAPSLKLAKTLKQLHIRCVMERGAMKALGNALLPCAHITELTVERFRQQIELRQLAHYLCQDNHLTKIVTESQIIGSDLRLFAQAFEINTSLYWFDYESTPDVHVGETEHDVKIRALCERNRVIQRAEKIVDLAIIMHASQSHQLPASDLKDTVIDYIYEKTFVRPLSSEDVWRLYTYISQNNPVLKGHALYAFLHSSEESNLVDMQCDELPKLQ